MNREDYLLKDNIKTNIRIFREKNNFTQTQVALILGTDRSTYTKWESGDTLPSVLQLKNLASIYGKTIDEFFKGDNINFFTVCSPLFETHNVPDYLSTLSNEEKVLLAKYRLLTDDEKEEIEKLVEKLKNKHS